MAAPRGAHAGSTKGYGSERSSHTSRCSSGMSGGLIRGLGRPLQGRPRPRLKLLALGRSAGVPRREGAAPRHGARLFPLSRRRWLSTPKTCKDIVGGGGGDGEGADGGRAPARSHGPRLPPPSPQPSPSGRPLRNRAGGEGAAPFGRPRACGARRRRAPSLSLPQRGRGLSECHLRSAARTPVGFAKVSSGRGSKTPRLPPFPWPAGDGLPVDGRGLQRGRGRRGERAYGGLPGQPFVGVLPGWRGFAP